LLESILAENPKQELNRESESPSIVLGGVKKFKINTLSYVMKSIAVSIDIY